MDGVQQSGGQEIGEQQSGEQQIGEERIEEQQMVDQQLGEQQTGEPQTGEQEMWGIRDGGRVLASGMITAPLRRSTRITCVEEEDRRKARETHALLAGGTRSTSSLSSPPALSFPPSQSAEQATVLRLSEMEEERRNARKRPEQAIFLRLSEIKEDERRKVRKRRALLAERRCSSPSRSSPPAPLYPLSPLPPLLQSAEQAIFLCLSEIEEDERRKARKRRALLAEGVALILLTLLPSCPFFLPTQPPQSAEQAIFLRLSEIEEGERRKERKRRALLAGGAALILLALLIAAAVAIGVTASKKTCQESADQSSNATSAEAVLTQQQQQGELVGTVQIGGRWGNVSTVVAKLDIQPNTNGLISANGGGATSSWDAATWQPSGGAVEDTSAFQQLANPELTPVDAQVLGMGGERGPPDLSVQGVDFQNGHMSVSGPDSWSFSLEPFKEVSLDLTALINVAAVVSNPNPIEIIAQEVNMDVSFYSVDVGYANIPDFTLPANSSATITVPFNIDNFPLLSFSDQSLITGSIANGELEFQVQLVCNAVVNLTQNNVLSKSCSTNIAT
ncbi:unnamed protein product [Closterium sp. Naga37s-1]|nr:unnamed protein product [Closterium sp. Naga37s-1]